MKHIINLGTLEVGRIGLGAMGFAVAFPSAADAIAAATNAQLALGAAALPPAACSSTTLPRR